MQSTPQNGVSNALPGAELLMERVLAAQSISHSPRLRELLAYLCHWTLTHPGEALSEEQIGINVFGRKPGYDTTSDGIVRVQISQLRKKLEQHFQTEGAAEPIIIEVPKRTYAAVFRLREQAAEPVVEALEVQVQAPNRWPRLRTLAVITLAAVIVALAVDNVRLRLAAASQNPASDRFLSRTFGNGHPAKIVISDGAMLNLNDLQTHLVTPQEYRTEGFVVRLLGNNAISVEGREMRRHLFDMNLTTLQDAQVASQMYQRLTALRIPANIVFARDFRFQPQVQENLILVGHKKANPWAALFEERLNFQYRWDSSTAKASITNRAPAAGEQAEYPVSFGVESYAVLALLPKPGGEGAVMLLEGGDMGSPLAAAAMVCRDDRIAELRSRLGETSPWFEVLMRTRLAGNAVVASEIIAHRLIHP